MYTISIKLTVADGHLKKKKYNELIQRKLDIDEDIERNKYKGWES